jgi:hypothetical protein
MQVTRLQGKGNCEIYTVVSKFKQPGAGAPAGLSSGWGIALKEFQENRCWHRLKPKPTRFRVVPCPAREAGYCPCRSKVLSRTGIHAPPALAVDWRKAWCLSSTIVYSKRTRVCIVVRSRLRTFPHQASPTCQTGGGYIVVAPRPTRRPTILGKRCGRSKAGDILYLRPRTRRDRAALCSWWSVLRRVEI